MACYLVTGGAGFIGGHIARRLARDGHRIIVLDDLSTGLRENVPGDATFVEADLAVRATFDRIPADSIDAVLHLGAQPSAEISHDNPLRDFDVNARGTLLLLEWAERRGIRRFLHASSMAVYGPTPHPATEDTPLRPLSFYGAGKVATEAYVRLFGNRGMDVTIFRMFNVYGSGQNMANLRQGMASIYMAYLLRGEPIVVKGSLERYRDLVHVSDVTAAWLAALHHPNAEGRVFNVGTGRRTTVAELLNALGATFGYAAGTCPYAQADQTAGDISGNVADITALTTALGWMPRVSLQDGLAEMAQWARSTVPAQR